MNACHPGVERLRARPLPNLALLLTGPSKIARLLALLAACNLLKGPAAERERLGCPKFADSARIFSGETPAVQTSYAP